MFEFLRVQYQLGRLNNIQLAKYVKAGCITEEEYKQICEKQKGK